MFDVMVEPHLLTRPTVGLVLYHVYNVSRLNIFRKGRKVTVNPTRRDDDLDSTDMGGPISSLIPVVAREHRALAGSLLRGFGLYPGQELVLMLLCAKEPRLQSDLGKLLDIEAPTTSKALQRLAAAGLLFREKSPEDARQVMVWLTQAGRNLQESIMGVWGALEAETTKDLTVSEQRELARLLRKIATSISEARTK